MSAAPVRLRFFASARDVVGVDELDVPASGAVTVGDALRTVVARSTYVDAERVLDRCSFLIDGVATTDRSAPIRGGALVDVMPPFAGG